MKPTYRPRWSRERAHELISGYAAEFRRQWGSNPAEWA